jgi:hypothetical protein
MAGAAMTIIPQTVGAFRTAAELTSHEPAQLRRTIEDQEARINEQDGLIEQQLQYIQELEQKLGRLQQTRPRANVPDNFALLSEISDLKEKNAHLEEAQERLQDGFDSLFQAQRDNLESSLEVLEKLPASDEVRNLYARTKKQSNAVERARELGKASPLNALRQMADLEKEIIQFITGRPLLTFARSDRYRAEVLLASLERDKKPLSTPEAVRILGEVEGKSIDPKQALRAMRWAANSNPTQAKFELRGARRKAWLCRINNKEPGK